MPYQFAHRPIRWMQFFSWGPSFPGRSSWQPRGTITNSSQFMLILRGQHPFLFPSFFSLECYLCPLLYWVISETELFLYKIISSLVGFTEQDISEDYVDEDLHCSHQDNFKTMVTDFSSIKSYITPHMEGVFVSSICPSFLFSFVQCSVLLEAIHLAQWKHFTLPLWK